MNSEGRIIKSVGGIYEVETADGTYNCKARGVFRNKGISPYTGDFVRIVTEENAEPLINEILPRKNEIVRPPMANLDMVLLVISSCEPFPNAYVIDKLIAVFESKGIETVPVFTKQDKSDCAELIDVYEKIGYRCFKVDNTTGQGTDEIKAYISGKTSALIGNSGVGKSSLINCIFPELARETGEISKKLGRGRHTTREVTLYPFLGGYIADTPGFSTVEVNRYIDIPKEELKYCFRELADAECRFSNCVHLKEAGCSVREKLKNGEISKSRYESYERMYGELLQSEKY
ncbi:MAG: ribosome small subunit-dependent GTPase A [Ruminiclostridium sp.]|nr:ribosome small subunit-dependent GTPase A [Ruminiclostridium sp.]